MQVPIAEEILPEVQQEEQVHDEELEEDAYGDGDGDGDDDDEDDYDYDEAYHDEFDVSSSMFYP